LAGGNVIKKGGWEFAAWVAVGGAAQPAEALQKLRTPSRCILAGPFSNI
jgi:hypothetical protein